MKKNKKYISFFLVLFFLIIVPFVMHAQEAVSGNSQIISIPNPFNCGDTSGGTKSCTLLDLITAVLQKIILPIAAVAAVMYIIFAGFKYVQAKGNPGEIEKAHQRLLWTLIGVGVLLAAEGISVVLQNTVKSFLK
jgi:type IV secretory pathway VirB2 component (pilin)